jgi:hypothetical protein
MEASGISPDIEEFIRRSIHSAEQLEILLLLHAEKRAWTPEQVNAHIRSSLDSVKKRLAQLVALELAKLSDDASAICYAPKTEALDSLVNRLASSYHERRIRILELIYSKPIDPLQTFSDAFKLKPHTHG